MADWILAIKVESIGDAVTSGPTDRRYRWATGTPTGGTANWRALYKPYMVDKFPSDHG